MPFVLAAIPVITGAVAASSLAGMLLIGSAVIGAIGYVTGNEDLMKVSSVLGLAGGLAGLAGYGSAAEVAAADTVTGAPAAAPEATVAQKAVEQGVTGVSEGAVTGAPAAPAAELTTQNLVGTSGQAGLLDKAAVLGDKSVADIGLSQLGPEIKNAAAIADPATIIPPANNIAPATGGGGGIGGGGATDGIDYAFNTGGGQTPPTPQSGILSDILSGVKDIKDATGDHGFASLLDIAGSGLKGAFGDNPNMEIAKVAKAKQALELEKYRQRIQNMNNIPLLQLGFRVRPEVFSGRA